MANATFVAAVGGDLDFSDKNSYYLYAVVAVGVLALIMAGVFRSQVLKASEGTEKMQEIGQAVQEGAAAYLSRQFRTLAVFAVVALADARRARRGCSRVGQRLEDQDRTLCRPSCSALASRH